MKMKGYKAFNHDMTCRDKQYAENTVFKEEEADICRKGMHFCANPLECLNYYPLLDNDGNLVTMAEVDALDEVKTDDYKKFCTKKLRVGAKLDLKGIVNASIGFVQEETKFDFDSVPKKLYDAQIGSSGDAAKIGSSGRYAQIGSSGDDAEVLVDGDHSIVACVGKRGKIKAPIGTWIVLAEYGDYDGEGWPVIGCVAAQIDGENLKADTWYTLKGGVITEVTE